MHSIYFLSTLVALVNAAPHPSSPNHLIKRQSIDFTQIEAATLPQVQAVPIIGSSESVAVQPASAAVDIADAAVSASPITQRSVIGEYEEKRSFGKRDGDDGDCSVQPAGAGATINE